MSADTTPGGYIPSAGSGGVEPAGDPLAPGSAADLDTIAHLIAEKVADILDTRHPRTMTVAEAGAYVRVTDPDAGERLVRKAIASGELGLMRGGRAWLLSRAELDNWLNRRAAA